jgi:hypothetical protein
MSEIEQLRLTLVALVAEHMDNLHANDVVNVARKLEAYICGEEVIASPEDGEVIKTKTFQGGDVHIVVKTQPPISGHSYEDFKEFLARCPAGLNK